ncbi:MAG: MoaD/ThiS family protein [Porticoccaceae bacterium]|nr:MoaD/ThiS family protein [Porticoccaceae bacterium]
MIKLLFFGRLGDFAKQVPATIQASTPAEIRERLNADYPDLVKELCQPQVLVSVNQMIVSWEQPLAAGSEVAFLPPVTGG